MQKYKIPSASNPKGVPFKRKIDISIANVFHCTFECSFHQVNIDLVFKEKVQSDRNVTKI